MRVAVTGATGFIGGEIARRLRARGDDVAALVRDPEGAAGLAGEGVELIAGDLATDDAVRRAVEGCDGVVHAAAVYAVDVPVGERPAMYRTNVLGTERVLRVAGEAAVDRTVHVSTVQALGTTGGDVVDETHDHSGRYVSYHDETKHLAHGVAERAAADGLPVVIAMPGAVYGSGGRSLVGAVLQRFVAGRLHALPRADVGVTAVHRDDVAVGVIGCLDRGRTGESYVLGGEITTVRGMIDVLAAMTGRRPPRLRVPTGVLRAVARLGPGAGSVFGVPADLTELLRACDGATYWARHDKAAAELGYDPRPLADGLRTLLAAPSPPPSSPSGSFPSGSS